MNSKLKEVRDRTKRLRLKHEQGILYTLSRPDCRKLVECVTILDRELVLALHAASAEAKEANRLRKELRKLQDRIAMIPWPPSTKS